MVLSVAAALTLLIGQSSPGRVVVLRYQPAPVANPLKGLVPYQRQGTGGFPHTMEFNYLPLKALVVGPGQYDWTALEGLLNDVASRGRQTIFRVFMEYPGQDSAIPAYLVQTGIKVHEYRLPPDPGQQEGSLMRTPDYSDPRVRSCLIHFIAALGKRVDGDPRVGYITAGLLGYWGEWHTWPRSELFAPRQVQVEVLDAFERAFKKTPILLRYPVGASDPALAPNAHRRMGYHDDSFAWATLHTGRPGEEWYFVSRLRVAGALEKWKRYPVGGEIRPEAWGIVFDPNPGKPEVQDFATCVRETHVTWLMDSGMFGSPPPAARAARARALVQRMGYEFHVPTARWSQRDGQLKLRFVVENRGVAPIYHPWPVRVGLLRRDGSLTAELGSHQALTGLLPGQRREVSIQWRLPSRTPAGTFLAISVPNPLPNGFPLRFANTTQDQHRPGWLTLGTL